MKAQKTNNLRLYIGIILGVVMILLFTMPIFRVQAIEVSANHYYTSDEIIEASGIKIGQHIFDLNEMNATKSLEQLPYISQVHIMRKLPNKVILNVEEKAPYVYVKFKGNHLCLNRQGKVIEQSQEKYHAIPTVKGIYFNSFKKDETLPILNQDSWFVLQEIMESLEKYDYVTKIKEIDITDLDEIYLYIDRLNVIMGKIEDFDEKLEVLIQAYEIKGYSVGKLDISTWSKTGSATLKPIS